jgi:hypothetical protein
MKRFIIFATATVFLVGSFSSCKKQIASDFPNPDAVSTGSLPKLMTGMMINARMRPNYWDMYTWVLRGPGEYSQFTAVSPTAQMYVPNTGYVGSRWDDYYSGSSPSNVSGSSPDYDYNGPGIISNWRSIQSTYAALTPAEQAQQQVFMNIAKVILCDQTAQVVDIWGDIPFFKAGSLTADGTITYAPYDKANVIYDTLIANLDQLNTYFDTATLVTNIATQLSTADLINAGSLVAWQRYANSLRLRLLMRISYYDQATAQAGVTAMLSNPAQYPMVTSNAQNIQLNMSPATLVSNVLSAMNSSPYAPAYILDTLMEGNGDPRTTVFWDSVRNQSYNGFPATGGSAAYSAGGFATYDSATFMYNYNIPGVLITAAEVSFLTAEANQRWGVGSVPAATAYANGITQSIEFYYNLNATRVDQSGYSAATLTPPTGAAVTAFINSPGIIYAGSQQQKLALIATQNWLNYFVLQSGQAWAEIRRTGYPKLFFPAATYANGTQPPMRVLYPSEEQLYNPNYASVSSEDQYSTKIFWDVN